MLILVLCWRVYPLQWHIQRIFRRTDFSRRFESSFDTPDWSRTKPWWGTRVGKVPVISKNLVLWNHLLLIKIYPPQPLMKLIQSLFFQKSYLTSDSKIKLSNRKEKILFINMFSVKTANVIEIIIFDLNVFWVNLSVQSHASLTRENPAYLQINYHFVYYLKYNELKRFCGNWVSAPKPVYELPNSSGCFAALLTFFSRKN